MLVTILVSIYKGRRFLLHKLDNLYKQTIIDNCQVVLLNCQNIENENEIYNYYPKKNTYVIEYPFYVGLYKSWNDGITLTDSKYIVNANLDDLWHPTYLERCVDLLENSNCDIVSTKTLITDLCNQCEPWTNIIGEICKRPYPLDTAGPCPVWRRDLHKFGLFGDYKVIGDARMWEIWYAHGAKFDVISEALALYYCNPLSLERRVDENGVKLRDIDLASSTIL